MAEAPYLSVVLTGRNDNFGGDFNDRLFAATTFNRENLERAGVPCEWIWVEWCPIPDKPYLAELLRERFPWWQRFYVADARWQAHFSTNPKLKFMEFFAKNVGIRRASSRFTLTTNTDIWLSRGAVSVLGERRLEERVLYRCIRQDLRREIGIHHVSYEVLEHPESIFRINYAQAPLYTNASGDFLLLDTKTWHELRGFNEENTFAKIHKDSNLCFNAADRGIPIELIGEVYHFDHTGSFNNDKKERDPFHKDAPYGPNWDWRKLYRNTDAWGLGGIQGREEPSGVLFFPYSGTS